jgi:hypothetical protein
MYAGYRSITMPSRYGFRISGDNRLEIEYYKAFKSSGIVLMPDMNYFEITGKGVAKRPAVEVKVEPVVVTDDIKVAEPVVVTDDIKVAEPVVVISETKVESPTQEINNDDVILQSVVGSDIGQYTAEVLETIKSVKKLASILKSRGIEADPHAKAIELRKMILDSND